MFASRQQRDGAAGTVDVAFTDRYGGVSLPPYDSLDLSRTRPGADQELSANFQLLARAFDVDEFVTMRQVQGTEVVEVSSGGNTQPTGDALVTASSDVALCVRVGDCAPVVLADADAGVVAVAHAGRPGVVAGVVPATVAAMRSLGAQAIEAWIGPHVCADCYEVPAAMRASVASVEPAAFACTVQGTPSVDIGAAVTAQLSAAKCTVVDASVCTLESPDLYSYRRDGAASGRFAGIVVRRNDRADGAHPRSR